MIYIFGEFSPSTSSETPDASRRDFIRVASAGGARGLSRAAQTAEDSAILADAQETSVDVRAREAEQTMPDDERFSMVIGLIGAIPSIDVLGAGYTPGILQFGVSALQNSDASMGDSNLGYRRDYKGATAFPASIVVGWRPQD